MPAQMCGAFFYIRAALEEVVHPQRLLAPCTPAEAGASLQALYGALRTALEMDARGMLERNPRTGQAWPASGSATVALLKALVHGLVTFALSDEAGMLLRMRATCGLTAAEETALRQLAERHKVEAERNTQELPKRVEGINANMQQAAAVDAARHGLRRCALPACDAQEAHPKSSSCAAAAVALRTTAPRTQWRTGSATSARMAARLRAEDGSCKQKSHHCAAQAQVNASAEHVARREHASSMTSMRRAHQQPSDAAMTVVCESPDAMPRIAVRFCWQ